MTDLAALAIVIWLIYAILCIPTVCVLIAACVLSGKRGRRV